MIKKIRSRIVHRRGVKSDEDVVHWVMFITWENAERGGSVIGVSTLQGCSVATVADSTEFVRAC